MERVILEIKVTVDLSPLTLVSTRLQEDGYAAFAIFPEDSQSNGDETIPVIDHRSKTIKAVHELGTVRHGGAERNINHDRLLNAVNGIPANLFVTQLSSNPSRIQIDLYETGDIHPPALLRQIPFGTSKDAEYRVISDESLWSWPSQPDQHPTDRLIILTTITDSSHSVIIERIMTSTEDFDLPDHPFHVIGKDSKWLPKKDYCKR